MSPTRKQIAKSALVSLGAALWLLAWLYFGGCQDDGCLIEDLQCQGHTLQICNGDNRWENVVDCRDYDLVCCDADCIEETQCEE